MASKYGSRKRLAVEEPEIAKAGVVGIAHDDVVEDFDLEQLTCSNEVTGDLDVRFAG